MVIQTLLKSTLPRLHARSMIALIMASLMLVSPTGFHGTAEAGSRDFGRLVIVISGASARDLSVCVTLRDLTNNFVVGSYCDNDENDQDMRTGRIQLELPRREFAVSARATGTKVVQVTPTRFALTARQTLHIKLDAKPR